MMFTDDVYWFFNWWRLLMILTLANDVNWLFCLIVFIDDLTDDVYWISKRISRYARTFCFAPPLLIHSSFIQTILLAHLTEEDEAQFLKLAQWV